MSQPVVAVEFLEVEHLREALDKLAEEHPYLESWRPAGGALPSFTLEWPHFAGFARTPEQEEYDPDNELVHLVSECLATRRFGNLPQWIRMGLAWRIEWDLRDSIYCFPGRDEFVYAVEHTAWPSELKNSFKGRQKLGDTLTGSEFMGWASKQYDGGIARVCFGMASFLGAQKEDALGRFLSGLQTAHQDGCLVVYPGEQRWERKLPYAVPVERQVELLQELCGDDAFEQATKYLAKGAK